MKNGLLVGCHQGLKNKDIKYIHTNIIKFLEISDSKLFKKNNKYKKKYS